MAIFSAADLPGKGPNVLQRIAETLRQQRANDDKFVKNLLYFFELRVPDHVANGAPVPYMYPLILSPQQIRTSEPFTVEQTFTLGGGIYVEESGILAREITISGNTGFKPRRQQRGGSAFSSIQFPGEGKSYGRSTAKYTVEALSGQRHFQFLQDSVFRTYADLKRDPSTSEGTELYFHMMRDNEHWRVVPKAFTSDRSVAANLLYPYDIQMLAVGPADAATIGLSEDKGVFDSLRDGFLWLKSSLANLRAGIQNLTLVQDEVRRTVLGGASILSDVASIADATEAFVTGAVKFVDVPHAYVAATHSALAAALSAFASPAYLVSGQWQDKLLNELRRLGDHLAVIGSYPQFFQKRTQIAVTDFNRAQAISTATTPEQRDAASSSMLTSLNDFAGLGTRLLPGDALRASGEIGLGSKVPNYTSATEKVVEQGDTISSLAQRYLGDSRKWKYLAIFNGLKAPFLTQQRLPNTLAVGDTILVPGFAKPVEVVDSLATLGVLPEAPSSEHLLGTDFFLGSVARGTYDFAVDVEQGATDFKMVAGVPNLQQGLRSRLLTERKSDMLYKNLGTQRVVGLGVTAVDLELVQFRTVETIQDDPRITGVRSIEINQDGGALDDAVVIEVDAEVRGFSAPITLKAQE